MRLITPMSGSGGNSEGERRNSSCRRNATSAERNMYLKPLLKLKQQEDMLERGFVSAIENMKIDSNLVQDIVNEHRELSLKRQSFLNAMYKNISDIACEMESVNRIARDPEEIQKLDVNTYKVKLIKLSQKMQDFKKSCPIQTLTEERATLDADLQNLEPSLQKYEKISQKSLLSTCQNIVDSKREKMEYKDMDDFHALVAVTGHTENWSTEDHLFFLKTRKRCESIPALVAAIQKKCPDLSAETIVNHAAWYKHYEDLREKQKAKVKEWRRQKEMEKKKNIEVAAAKEMEDLDVDFPIANFPVANVEERSVNVQKKGQGSTSELRSTSTSAGSSKSDKSEKKELIKQWKTERENKRMMDEEQIKLQMKLKKEAEENRRKKRREKIQGALEEYKRKKFLDNALKGLEDSKEKCKYDATLIKAFRKQDKEFTKKRKDLIQRSKKPSKSELVDIKRVELVETRDYSTLLESTEVWREKCKADDWTRHPKEFHYIKDVPRICIRWRNEESEDLKI